MPPTPGIRALMKLPASLADIGLALLALYALRDRLAWGVTAAIAILLIPAVFDISAWWGQYESIYLLFALAAVVFALEDRNLVAAAALALALMTKPQALPFLVPFAAWFWARGGLRGFVTAAAVGAGVIVLVWLPFIAAGGPAHYLKNLAEYPGDIFAILSLRAWNLWWLVQEAFAGGQFVADDNAILGPVTFRQLGYAMTALFELVVFIAVLRDPRPRTLILGLAASTLVAFCFLTSMHERYAYGALIFLMLLLVERPARALAVAFAVVFTLNLLAAVPPTPAIGDLLPVSGLLGVTGVHRHAGHRVRLPVAVVPCPGAGRSGDHGAAGLSPSAARPSRRTFMRASPITANGVRSGTGRATIATTSGRLMRAGDRHRDVVELGRRPRRRDRQPLRSVTAQDPERQERRWHEDRQAPGTAVPRCHQVAERSPGHPGGRAARAGSAASR